MDLTPDEIRMIERRRAIKALGPPPIDRTIDQDYTALFAWLRTAAELLCAAGRSCEPMIRVVQPSLRKAVRIPENHSWVGGLFEGADWCASGESAHGVLRDLVRQARLALHDLIPEI